MGLLGIGFDEMKIYRILMKSYREIEIRNAVKKIF